MADTTNRWYHDDPNAWWSTQNPVVKDALQRATQLAMGSGGMTKVIRNSSGINMIKAFDDLTGREVGHLGYRQMPGRGGRLLDIKVNPNVQGQGYGNQLIHGFEQEMGPNMADAGMAGTISNSPGFWRNLAKRWQEYPVSRGIETALQFAGY
jgi:ribosomal protein S18 acetylase RimI-like enzyme